MTIEVQDSSTEERIKQAARKLFMQKGYANTKTRDIANEANINLALLNYYFRSKEKLFGIIMTENMVSFLSGLGHLLNQDLPFDVQVERLVESYIVLLKKQPDLPLFVLSELRSQPEHFLKGVGIQETLKDVKFFKELFQKTNGGVDPMHFIMNLFSMTVFPYISKPLLQAVGGLDDAHFNKLMEERVKLIPIWVNQMIAGS